MNEYYRPGPCQSCRYTQHCAGKRDAITGVSGFSDECNAYRVYRSTEAGRKIKNMPQVPYRVQAANNLYGEMA